MEELTPEACRLIISVRRENRRICSKRKDPPYTRIYCTACGVLGTEERLNEDCSTAGCTGRQVGPGWWNEVAEARGTR